MGKSELKKGRVAVIGAGPAGLTAAHDLTAMGYETTIFETAPAPGGMLLLGIPEYRLPRDVLEREIEDILGQGVEIRLNTRLGIDFTLSSLKNEGYEAVFLAMGAHHNVPLGLEGEELEGVVSGIDFLRKVNLGQAINIGRRVAVVGGGNVAMDTVRTALRLADDHVTAMDAVRTASRLGAKKAFILYRRSREEMPASDVEIEEAVEEGIEVHYQVAPVMILGDNGRVRALECIKMELGEPDEGGRRRPIPIKGSEFVLEADTVISAIGQVADLSFITADDNISVTPAGTVSVEQTTLATTQAGVFAGGDLASPEYFVITDENL
jgi:NADPH-dependent glutamate synthase beta subunit-like oxidoreductase